MARFVLGWHSSDVEYAHVSEGSSDLFDVSFYGAAEGSPEERAWYAASVEGTRRLLAVANAGEWLASELGAALAAGATLEQVAELLAQHESEVAAHA